MTRATFADVNAGLETPLSALVMAHANWPNWSPGASSSCGRYPEQSRDKEINVRLLTFQRADLDQRESVNEKNPSDLSFVFLPTDSLETQWCVRPL